MKHTLFPFFAPNDHNSLLNIMSNNEISSEADSFPDFSQLVSIFAENHDSISGTFPDNIDIVDEVFGELDSPQAGKLDSPADNSSCSFDELDDVSSPSSVGIEREQDSPMSSSEDFRSTKPKKRVRRDRRKPLESKTLLAKSLMEWLEDERYNPTAIKWICKAEGLFQITDSIAIANLWGDMKGNSKMTHEKLSRALRHYYKDGTLERIEGKKKLYYKFSEAAMAKFKLK